MSENLTQKELLIRLMDKVDNIEKEQSNHHSFSRAKLESIEDQAIRTNGRVLKLEEEQAKIQQWKAYITGGMALALAIGLPNLITLAQL